MALACTCYSGANFLRQTIFNGINKVMPGETMVFDLDQKKFKTVHRNLVKPLSNKKFEISIFKDDELPDELRKIPVLKPGSRDLI